MQIYNVNEGEVSGGRKLSIADVQIQLKRKTDERGGTILDVYLSNDNNEDLHVCTVNVGLETINKSFLGSESLHLTDYSTIENKRSDLSCAKRCISGCEDGRIDGSDPIGTTPESAKHVKYKITVTQVRTLPGEQVHGETIVKFDNRSSSNITFTHSLDSKNTADSEVVLTADPSFELPISSGSMQQTTMQVVMPRQTK